MFSSSNTKTSCSVHGGKLEDSLIEVEGGRALFPILYSGISEAYIVNGKWTSDPEAEFTNVEFRAKTKYQELHW